MLAISLIICGAACILYGVSIMLVWSGTAFFALWYLMGAAAVAAGIAMRLGLWQHLPAALARGICIASLVALTGVVSLSIFLMGVAATCDPDEAPDDLDYLVVLGAQVYGNKEPSVVLRFRLDAALSYLKGHEDCKVVVSGGHGPNEPITEAWPPTSSGRASHQSASSERERPPRRCRTSPSRRRRWSRTAAQTSPSYA